ncbi:transposase family protein [Streptacidiphilus sp. P02-A3a]|nr:transposase family protein [Streptacidiphilus sp. P02-A3a]
MSTRPGSTCPGSTLRLLARHLRRRHREIGSRWQRLSASRQTLLVLGHLRCGDTYGRLAAAFDIDIDIDNVYRHFLEAVAVLAALAPTLEQAVSTRA